MRVDPEPDPSDEQPLRYAFLISTSVVLMQLGIGLNTSQNARSCESSTFRSSLSRFLSTLLCAKIGIENAGSQNWFVCLKKLDVTHLQLAWRWTPTCGWTFSAVSPNFPLRSPPTPVASYSAWCACRDKPRNQYSPVQSSCSARSTAFGIYRMYCRFLL